MPPKKNAAKSEKVADNSEELASKKEKSSNNNAGVQFSPRILRPRKTTPNPSPSTSKPVKAKKPAKAAGDVNGTTSTKKRVTKRGKKTKLEKDAEEEPAAKISKIEEEEEENLEDHVDKQDSPSSIYEFNAKTIEGEEISLSKYKGHVCVIVNVASKCGHTASNYKEFVELFDKYGESKGLKILAFPCNQFGKQEPGDNEKICQFAKKKNVKFDMFEKIDVNGKKAHPLWNFLTSQKEGPKGAKIDWNFTKFLINKDGQVVDRFKPTIKPLALVSELEKLW